MEFLDDISASDKESGQQVKTNEINGERFLFHSLPKEYQDWQTNYYIMERTGDPDRGVVSSAYLNGYMWQTLGDASYYAIGAASAIIFSIIKLRLGVNLLNLMLVLSIFLPVMLYIGWHFIYYGIMRAMVVGPITEAAIHNTSYMFYKSFLAILFALIIAFVYCLFIINDLLFLLAMTIQGLDISSTSLSSVTDILISIHNVMVKMAHPASSIAENTYFITLAFVGFTLFLCWFIENKAYTDKKLEVETDLKITESKQGYPIEHAQKLITNWRNNN